VGDIIEMKRNWGYYEEAGDDGLTQYQRDLLKPYYIAALIEAIERGIENGLFG